MADILYVQDGYVTLGYVEATRDASASFTAQGTLTATGGKQLFGTATLEANLSGLTWDEMGTWQSPRQEYWQDNFIAEAESFKGGTFNFTAQGILSSTARSDFEGTASLTDLLNATILGNAVGSGVIIPLGSFTASIVGQALTEGASTQSAQGTFTVSRADLKAEGNSTLQAQGTIITDGDLQAIGSFTLQGAGSTLNVGDALTEGTFNLTAQSTLTFEAIIVEGGTANLVGQATLSVPEEGIFITRRSTFNLQGVASTSITGGFLAEAQPQFTGALSVLFIGSQFAIEPYRVFPIQSETRINILQQETRLYLVPSETRTYEIQHLNLVDEPGILDRREG